MTNKGDVSTIVYINNVENTTNCEGNYDCNCDDVPHCSCDDRCD